MNEIEFDFKRFNIHTDSNIYIAISQLTDSYQCLVKYLSKENDILKLKLSQQQKSPQNNIYSNVRKRMEYNPESAVLKVLTDSHPSFGGHDIRNMIFNFLPNDDFLAVTESCKSFNETMKIKCPDLISRKQMLPSTEHVISSLEM